MLITVSWRLPKTNTQTYITAPCPAGKYSLTGHEPCEECPLHYYQDTVAQTTCKECSEREKTESVGRNSSSSCITIGMFEISMKLKSHQT